jgi:hypothetical protein
MKITHHEAQVSVIYCSSNVIEQLDDNEERLGSKSQGTHRGVNYHVKRKKVAELLQEQLRRVEGYFSSYAFTKEGKALCDAIRSTGVTQPTIKSWLVKYQGFDKDDTLYQSFHVK